MNYVWHDASRMLRFRPGASRGLIRRETTTSNRLAGGVARMLSNRHSPGWHADLASPAATGAVDCFKDVEPLLAQHCYSCHGDGAQQAGLRLDLRQNALRPSVWRSCLSLGLLGDRWVAAFAADFFAQKLFHVLELRLVASIHVAQVLVSLQHHLCGTDGIGRLFDGGQFDVR